MREDPKDPSTTGSPDLFVPYCEPRSKDPSTDFPLNGIDITTLSDEDLIAIGRQSPVLYEFWSTKVVRLSIDLIMKYGEAVRIQEIEAVKYVTSRTGVSTPRLHRYFFARSESSDSHNQCGYMIMDYIDGDTIDDVWVNLPNETRIDIVKQVADMVSRLQAIHFDQPGPLGGGDCRGFWFSDYGAGPFDNGEHFNTWFTSKLEYAKKTGRASKHLPAFEYTSFVMVHHDLRPYNLILDRNGSVWIIDWGNAGAYPSIFEAAVMCDSRWSEFNDHLLPLIYNDPKEREQLLGVRSALSTFPRR